MNKKLAGLVLALVLVMNCVLPCFAAGSVSATTATVTGVTDANGNEVLVFSSVEEAAAAGVTTGFLVATPSDAYDAETDSVIALVSSSSDDYEVAAYVDVVWIGEGSPVFPLTLSFDVPGATAENLVAVTHKPSTTGVWQKEAFTVSSETDIITVTVDSLSPFAFVVTASSSSGQTSTTVTSGGSASPTGDVSIAVPVVLAVVAAAAIVVLIAKGRKEA